MTPISIAIYEIVDVTDDERYFTCGLFPTLSSAIDALSDPHIGDEDHEDYAAFEIRKRDWGYGSLGTCVFKRKWKQVYNDEIDECDWEEIK